VNAKVAATAPLPLAITMGDPAGIGPEIVVKAFRDAPALTAGAFVAGDLECLRKAAAAVARPFHDGQRQRRLPGPRDRGRRAAHAVDVAGHEGAGRQCRRVAKGLDDDLGPDAGRITHGDGQRRTRTR